MSVRAKFTVQSITRQKGWGGAAELQTIKLMPVNGSSEENKQFFASTPSGSIELGVVNPEAGKYFELNQEYYIDFTKA